MPSLHQDRVTLKLHGAAQEARFRTYILGLSVRAAVDNLLAPKTGDSPKLNQGLRVGRVLGLGFRVICKC